MLSINTVDPIIKSLEGVISTLKSEIVNIDEEYKKLLEEAKESLTRNLEESEKQLEYWKAVREGTPVETKKRSRRKKEVVETDAEIEVTEESVAPVEEISDEKITDTIFTENNEIPVEEDITEEEEAKTEEIAETKESGEAPSEFFDGVDLSDDGDSETAVVDFDSEEWPEQPEEWK